jgi:hypothetical protein
LPNPLHSTPLVWLGPVYLDTYDAALAVAFIAAYLACRGAAAALCRSTIACLRRTKWSNLFVLLLSLSLSVAALELASEQYYGYHFRRPFSFDDIYGRMYQVKASNDNPFSSPTAWRILGYSTHPYMGYVDNSPNHNRYGFNGEEPIVRKDDDTVVAGVMGGSVAFLCYEQSRGAFERRLRSGFPGKQIKTYNMALISYKQPQQLMELTYFLSLGGEYDYILNIDGYNEIGGAVTNNVDVFNISLAYPSFWPQFTIDRHRGKAMNEYMSLDGSTRSMASFFSKEPMRSSRFMLTLWSILNERRELELTKKVSEINVIEDQGRDIEATGPMTAYGSANETLRGLVELWSRSAVQMDGLCKSKNITYVEMIQPNQYLAGSKTLSDEEIRKAFNTNLPAYPAMRDGYPMLLAEAKRLSDAGVPVHDSTMLFKGVDSTVYSDICCHYNQQGCDMLMDEAARLIIDADRKGR